MPTSNDRESLLFHTLHYIVYKYFYKKNNSDCKSSIMAPKHCNSHRMQFLNDIIKSEHGFKSAQKFNQF